LQKIVKELSKPQRFADITKHEADAKMPAN
jgi:hypothetical protein